MRQFLDQLPRVIAAKRTPCRARATMDPRSSRSSRARSKRRCICGRPRSPITRSRATGRRRTSSHPYRLAYAQGGLYLLAYVPGSTDEVRTFAVERIQDDLAARGAVHADRRAAGRGVPAFARRPFGAARARRNRVPAAVADYVRARQLAPVAAGRATAAAGGARDDARRLPRPRAAELDLSASVPSRASLARSPGSRARSPTVDVCAAEIPATPSRDPPARHRHRRHAARQPRQAARRAPRRARRRAARGVEIALVTGRSFHFTPPIADAPPAPAHAHRQQRRAGEDERRRRPGCGTCSLATSRAARAGRHAAFEDSVAIVFDRPDERARSSSSAWTGRIRTAAATTRRTRRSSPRRRRRSPTMLTEDPIQVMFNGSVAPMRALVAALRAMPIAGSVLRGDHRVRAARLLARGRQRRGLLEGHDARALGGRARPDAATM